MWSLLKQNASLGEMYRHLTAEGILVLNGTEKVKPI